MQAQQEKKEAPNCLDVKYFARVCYLSYLDSKTQSGTLTAGWIQITTSAYTEIK